ncbi:50S ribosomal protein L13 [candidate division KSB1 bacterium]|nr:50S ribosomal protein L13 [candidate division KSB1 bacterium]
MKTITPKQQDIERKWYVVDANGEILGRIASKVAQILRGKHKPMYTPHLDVGDHVIIINADKVRVTGRKPDQKRYYRHSGYPSGLRSKTLGLLMHEKPEWVLEHAIKGMLPHNRLGRKMFKKLKIYSGEQHPHGSQKPEKLEIA